VQRRAALLTALISASGQSLYLGAYAPMCRLVKGTDLPPVPDDVRFLGIDLDGFVVRDTVHLAGWLPQALFVTLASVLTYAVLCAAPPRPRRRVLGSLLGVLLLTAGLVDTLCLLTGLRPPPVPPYQPEWVGDAYVDGAAGLAAQFALCIAWLPLLAVAEVWLLQRWPVFHPLVGAPQPAAPRTAAPAPARRRRDVVAAGLIPVVLLALVGGRVLRHAHVGQLDQHASVTFDPDLWTSYRPSETVREWSGVLYPALRLRPLPTEQQAGWLGTLLLCCVFVAVLAAALYVLAGRAGTGRPWRTVLNCWFATLFAALAAAFVESGLLQHQDRAPRPRLEDGVGSLTVTVGDAVRFGTCWGWAVGVAFLLALWAASRRAAPAERFTEEEGLSHAG
jgi:hypothetical protein